MKYIHQQKPKKEKIDLNWIVKPEDRVERIVFNNGNVYEGQTSRWLMHGRGTYTWSDGTSYTVKFAIFLIYIQLLQDIQMGCLPLFKIV